MTPTGVAILLGIITGLVLLSAITLDIVAVIRVQSNNPKDAEVSAGFAAAFTIIAIILLIVIVTIVKTVGATAEKKTVETKIVEKESPSAE